MIKNCLFQGGGLPGGDQTALYEKDFFTLSEVSFLIFILRVFCGESMTKK